MKKVSKKKIAARILFLGYLTVLFYLLFFSVFTGRSEVYEEYHYNFIPFEEIRRYLVISRSGGTFVRLINIEGNVLAFLPFGFFLPLLWKRFRHFYRTVLSTAAFSLIVELLQLVTRVGSCDIDDIILNTLGGAIGYLLYLLFTLAMEHYQKKRSGTGQDNGVQGERDDR